MNNFRSKIHAAVRRRFDTAAPMPVELLEHLTSDIVDLVTEAIVQPGISDEIDNAVALAMVSKAEARRPEIAAVAQGDKRVEYADPLPAVFIGAYRVERDRGTISSSAMQIAARATLDYAVLVPGGARG